MDGNIFISCGRVGVALKLPSETLGELFKAEDVEPLRYFPKGHTKKEYAVLPDRMLNNNIQFRELLDKSIEYAIAP